MIPIPAWQKTAAIAATPKNLTRPNDALNGRLVPDVAALAFANVINVGTASGTSAASPQLAALIIMANQQIRAADIKSIDGAILTVGNLTNLLYDKATGLQGACADIVCGTNAIPCNNGSCYEATRGWDACTGWGNPMPQKTKFIAALVANASPRPPANRAPKS
jgi:kumamolisin